MNITFKHEDEQEYSEVYFEGYLLNDDAVDPKEYINKRYRENGMDCITDLNGSFVGCIVDNSIKQAFLFNDRFGSRDMYFFDRKDEIKVDTSFERLRSELTETSFDVTAIYEFIEFGYPLYDRTFLNEIKVLEPARVIVIDLENNRISKIKKYWEINYCEVPIKENEAKKKLWDLLEKATQLCVKEKELVYGVGVSGGADSRCLLKLLIEENRKIFPFTYGDAPSEAQHIADKISKTFGLKNTMISIEKHFLSKYSDIALRSNPMNSLLNTWYFSSYRGLEAVDILINGWNGDNLMGSHLNNNMNKFVDLQSALEYCYSLHSNLNAYEKGELFVKNKENNTKEDFEKNAYKLEIHDFKYVCEAFDMLNRQTRYIKSSPGITYYNKLEWRSPFIENNFVDFILSIPFELKLDRKLYFDTLRDYMGKLANIRFERSIKKLASENKYIAKIKAFLFKVDSRIYKLFGKAIVYKGTHKNLRQWLEESGEKELIRNTIKSENKLFDEIINRRYVVKNFDNLYSNNIEVLGNLYTIKVWLDKIYN